MSDQSTRLTAALSRSYRIERELGAGGMATVYLAEDLKHHRRVAVKLLREALKTGLPDNFDNREEFAHKLVPQAMNQVYGEGKWCTEKRPKKSGRE